MTTTTLDTYSELVQALKQLDGYQRANQRQAIALDTYERGIRVALYYLKRGDTQGARTALLLVFDPEAGA